MWVFSNILILSDFFLQNLEEKRNKNNRIAETYVRTYLVQQFSGWFIVYTCILSWKEQYVAIDQFGEGIKQYRWIFKYLFKVVSGPDVGHVKAATMI